MSEVKRYAYRLSGVSQLVGFNLEVIEYSGDGLPYVLASDYDQLKANFDLWVTDNTSLLKERDALRKQLDEARELLEMSRTYLMRVGDKESIDAWLEANK